MHPVTGVRWLFLSRKQLHLLEDGECVKTGLERLRNKEKNERISNREAGGIDLPAVSPPLSGVDTDDRRSTVHPAGGHAVRFWQETTQTSINNIFLYLVLKNHNQNYY